VALWARTTWRAVLVRPDLWRVAVGQALRLAPRGWWRRPPFVPRPDARYLGFRLETQYGTPGATPRGADVVSYLEWCRAHDRAMRHRSPRPRR
jgi:hypothetical protein